MSKAEERAEEIFHKQAEKLMIKYNSDEFKETHPKLFRAIIAAMDEHQFIEKHLYQISLLTKKAKENLEEYAASQPRQEWVEFKKGNPLPEYDESVLWLYEDGNMFVDALDKDGSPWITEGMKVFEYSPPIKVTHWMPLPTAPQSKEQ